MEPGRELVVDTGHLVAFTDGLEYSIGKVGGLRSLALGGEGAGDAVPGRRWGPDLDPRTPEPGVPRGADRALHAQPEVTLAVSFTSC